MGVVSECCKEVYRYPTPLVLALFLAASSLFLFIFKCFFHYCSIIHPLQKENLMTFELKNGFFFRNMRL